MQETQEIQVWSLGWEESLNYDWKIFYMLVYWRLHLPGGGQLSGRGYAGRAHRRWSAHSVGKEENTGTQKQMGRVCQFIFFMLNYNIVTFSI